MRIEFDDKGKFFTDIISRTPFLFNETGVNADGKILGQVKPTDIRPLFGPRLEAAYFKLGAEIFGATAADILAARQRR